MKFFIRRFLLILMMVWVPIYSVVVAISPHSAHQSNASHELNAGSIHSTDHHLHNADQKQIVMDSNMASTQLCEINTLCHTSCGTLITAEHSINILVSNSSLHQSRNVNTVSFIPDLPQHPPRA
jgi:hypothetical protein